MARRMERKGIKKYSYEQLEKFTDDFSEEKFLGSFQFGEVYSGVIEEEGQHQHVMVKVWEIPKCYIYWAGDNVLRLMDEILLLQQEEALQRPDLINLLGYCLEADEADDEEFYAAVYDFEPLETLYNLIPQASFTWLQRIKVAFQFAHLVNFFHTWNLNLNFKPTLIRNISARHIVVNKDYNPKLFDFGMISGGIFPDRASIAANKLLGCFGYRDEWTPSGEWSTWNDVYAYGALLLMLISKRAYDEEDRKGGDSNRQCEWDREAYERCGKDGEVKRGDLVLAHQSLFTDSDYCRDDGLKITKLALKCMCEDRPSMKKVTQLLSKLQVVRKHAEYFGVEMPTF